jgi:hypothetical protein
MMPAIAPEVVVEDDVSVTVVAVVVVAATNWVAGAIRGGAAERLVAMITPTARRTPASNPIANLADLILVYTSLRRS